MGNQHLKFILCKLICLGCNLILPSFMGLWHIIILFKLSVWGLLQNTPLRRHKENSPIVYGFCSRFRSISGGSIWVQHTISSIEPTTFCLQGTCSTTVPQPMPYTGFNNSSSFLKNQPFKLAIVIHYLLPLQTTPSAKAICCTRFFWPCSGWSSSSSTSSGTASERSASARGPSTSSTLPGK